MYRLISFVFVVLLALSVSAKTEYSCFLSQDVNLETGEVSNQVTNNSLITIFLDGNKLTLGAKKYTLYNKCESNNGFTTITYYDAIDNSNQRCKIRFIIDESADWTTKNAIIIWYNEISKTAKWYQSREPITR